MIRVLSCLALLPLLGCSGLERFAVQAVFHTVSLPADREFHDIPYGTDPKQRLDLFTAEGEGRPTLVFVHGGSWVEGDRDLTFGGEEIYGNIGRFYARRDVNVAVISYRLQPSVSFREQVDDVAAAVGWVHRNIEPYGGDPRSIFVSGHSAGAQLSSFAVAAGEPLEKHGVDPDAICGVVSISGTGLDPADEKTYTLGASRAFYARVLRVPGSAGSWQQEASTVARIGADGRRVPPWLIFFAGKEEPYFPRQAELLRRAVIEAGGEAEVHKIPGIRHRRIVAEFSQRGSGPARPTLAFIEKHRDCRQGVEKAFS